MGKLRIFVIGTRGFPDVQGGVERHCEELYTRLARKGCDITVATRTPYVLPEKRMPSWHEVSLLHLWCPKTKAFEAIIHSVLGVFAAARKSPDVLHIHAVGPSLVAPLAKLLGLKVVVTNHGPDYQRAKWGRTAKAVLKLGEYMGTKFADQVIVISSAIKELMISEYNRTDPNLIPNGVTLPTIRPNGETLKKYGLEPQKYLFTAVRFVPEKGLHDLIDAYRKIENPDFKLVIAGDADHETSYSLQIKEMADKVPGVVLTGFISGEPLAELYSNAGLFILPSYHEGLPIALLEAMSFELPVLISNIPQHQEVALPEFRYFPVSDTEALSAKMVELMSRGISEEEKAGQRTMIEEKYNWDRIADQTYKVYRSVKREAIRKARTSPFRTIRKENKVVSRIYKGLQTANFYFLK
jgi:glycosyltransferase involved in cell wall biosynthesis